MTATPSNPIKLEQWKQAVERLIDDAARWAQARHWLVHRETKIVTEQQTGAYEVPILTIQTNQGRVRIEPVALDIVGATGRVDIYAWPSLTDVVLVDFDRGWRVLDQSRTEIARGWTEDTFVNITQSLATAA